MSKGQRKGIMVVVYRKRRGAVEFLVLHRIMNWTGWELLKGGVESRETLRKAAGRELAEECSCRGRDILKIRPIGKTFSIKYPKKYRERTGYNGAVYRIFAAELSQGARVSVDNNIEREHDSFKWLTKEKAVKLVRPDLKRVLKNVARLIHRS